MENVKFILASASPRRHELLNAAGIEHEIFVTDADENGGGKIKAGFSPAEWYALEASRIKCEAAVRATEASSERTFVIAADTVVSPDGETVFGKPMNGVDAARMLGELSGKDHLVIGGITVAEIRDSAVCTAARVCVTKVTMKELTSSEIEAYVETGEPSDKAGAYAIQGLGGCFVESIDGDYANVVGLSVSTLSELLKTEFGFDVTALWKK